MNKTAAAGIARERAVLDVYRSGVEQGDRAAVAGGLVVPEIAVVQRQFLGAVVQTDYRSIGCAVGAGELDILDGAR